MCSDPAVCKDANRELFSCFSLSFCTRRLDVRGPLSDQAWCLCSDKVLVHWWGHSSTLLNEGDGSLAKGGLNGGHRPPLPCDLPMGGGFPYEFGPETERKIPGHGGPIFSAHRLEGRFSGPRPQLEAPAASSHRATPPKFSKGAPLGHGGRLPAPPTAAGGNAPSPPSPTPFGLRSCAPPPHPPPSPSIKKAKKAIVKKSEASLLFHKLVSDRRLSCCAVESSMSDIPASRARQLHQIASLVGLTEKFRPAAR